MMFGMMGPWMWLLYLALLGLFVVGVVWFVRQMPAVQQAPTPRAASRPEDMEDPKDVLRLRYARGEITRLLGLLREAGFRVHRTFCLSEARSTGGTCSCPHHGSMACTCEWCTYLVYDKSAKHSP